MNPYSKVGGDRMMDRVNSEMARGLAEEKKTTKALLRDARRVLLADPIVRSIMGADLELGKPFSRASSSSMVNGVTRSNLQLGIPASGSRGTGRIRMVADQDGIRELELDAGGRVIDVMLDGSGRGGRKEVMNASVVDRDDDGMY